MCSSYRWRNSSVPHGSDERNEVFWLSHDRTADQSALVLSPFVTIVSAGPSANLPGCGVAKVVVERVEDHSRLLSRGQRDGDGVGVKSH